MHGSVEASAVLPETLPAPLAGKERSCEQEMVGLPFSGFDPARGRWWGPKPKESLKDQLGL